MIFFSHKIEGIAFLNSQMFVKTSIYSHKKQVIISLKQMELNIY